MSRGHSKWRDLNLTQTSVTSGPKLEQSRRSFKETMWKYWTRIQRSCNNVHYVTVKCCFRRKLTKNNIENSRDTFLGSVGSGKQTTPVEWQMKMISLEVHPSSSKVSFDSSGIHGSWNLFTSEQSWRTWSLESGSKSRWVHRQQICLDLKLFALWF